MMKKAPVVPVVDVPDEGLIKLLDTNVMLFCMVYIYTGKLIGVNDDFVLLENGKIVYETGAFTDNKLKDAQQVSEQLYVRRETIESYCTTKKT